MDITAEASMMASCMTMSRKGHLDQLFHMFTFLKNKHNSEMAFDPSELDIDETQFSGETWTYTVYGDCSEDIPPNAPACQGFGFKIRAFVSLITLVTQLLDAQKQVSSRS